jgi:hypothetical protein
LKITLTEAAHNAIPSAGRYFTAGWPLLHCHCLGDEPLQAITDTVGDMQDIKSPATAKHQSKLLTRCNPDMANTRVSFDDTLCEGMRYGRNDFSH